MEGAGVCSRFHWHCRGRGRKLNGSRILTGGARIATKPPVSNAMSASGVAAFGSPSPRGEGWGEGEETLRKPARLRTAEEIDYPVRRRSKLHARQRAESLAVASRLPPHPCPPAGRGHRPTACFTG